MKANRMPRTWLCFLLAAISGCAAVDAANGGGGPGDDASGAMSDGLPCDVRALLQARCQSCHGATTHNGAPMSLVTAADLMAKSIADPARTFAQIAVLRMQNPQAPMPPPPAPSASTGEIMAVENWIAAGYPLGTCNGLPDAGSMSMNDAGSSGSYSDDFEAYGGAITNGAMLGPWKASVGGTGVVMIVDGVRPHSGSKSLHITVPAGASAHGTLTQTAAAGLIPGNDMFGRAMVFYNNTGGNNLPVGVHSWLFNSSGMSTAAGGNVSMNMGGGGAKLQLNYHPPAPQVEQSVQGGMITAGQWHCIQWQYDGSGTPPHDLAKVWIDGTLAVDIPASKGWKLATPWSTFAFGFTHYQTLTNPVDVYLDDFALSGSMVPCP